MIAAARRAARRLRRDERGLALIEFAFALPILLLVGGYGVELSNFALCNLRVSQYALNLADAASRVGVDINGGVTQIREADLDDVMQGVRLQSAALNLTTYGRVTLSSLENVQQSYDSAPVQRLHWQRCVGLKSGTGYDSTYGTAPAKAGTDDTSANAGTTMTAGMGDTGAKVGAPSGSGVMFVEINYSYQPLFGSMFIGARTVHYIASFIVRDNRDYTRVYNPSPAATRLTCDLHTA